VAGKEGGGGKGLAWDKVWGGVRALVKRRARKHA
jgi:hypothetical protein